MLDLPKTQHPVTEHRQSCVTGVTATGPIVRAVNYQFGDSSVDWAAQYTQHTAHWYNSIIHFNTLLLTPLLMLTWDFKQIQFNDAGFISKEYFKIKLYDSNI